VNQLNKRQLAAIVVLMLAFSAALYSGLSATAATTPNLGSWGARVTCTADAAGFCAVSHPAGVVPDSVVVTPELPAIVSVDLRTATTFRVRFCRLVSSTGSCTPLTGVRVFYVHLDWAIGSPSPTSSPVAPSPSDSPSIPPSPSASPSASLTPPPATFPDASNTGVPAGTTLTVVNGDMTVNTAGAVVDAKDINGCLVVTAPSVRVMRSKIHCASFEVVQHGDNGVLETDTSRRLVITDSEISCTSGTGGTAVGDTNVTLDRVEVTGCENGFDADQGVTVQNSWIHALLGGVGHTDGLQMAHYLDGCTTSACEVNHARFIDVIHNTIEAIDGTSAVISNPSGDNDIYIRNNLMTGGAYTLYCPYSGKGGTNWFAQNNRFIRTSGRPNSGAFGPVTGCGDETPANVTGNVWDDDGSAVPLG
jgi:hypothetical protein